MELSQDDPDRLMPTFLGEHSVELHEAIDIDAIDIDAIAELPLQGATSECGAGVIDGSFDVGEITIRELLLKALHLEGLDLLVIQYTILISVAKVEYSFECINDGGFEVVLLCIIYGCYGMSHGFLAQKEDLVDVVMFPGASSYARIDLFELRHDW